MVTQLWLESISFREKPKNLGVGREDGQTDQGTFAKLAVA